MLPLLVEVVDLDLEILWISNTCWLVVILALCRHQHGSIGNSSFNVGSRTGGNTQVAVNRSNPGKGNVSAMMASLNQNNIGGGGGRRSRGGLDMNNWQSTRTASLRIDNIAGGNVHTLANAMT